MRAHHPVEWNRRVSRRKRLAPDESAREVAAETQSSRRTFSRFVIGFLLVSRAGMAQQSRVVRRIGRLEPGMPWTREDEAMQASPLRELGWIEGQNLLVERRYARSPEMLKPLADELVAAMVEIIVTGGAEATQAAMRSTTVIPIVSAAIRPAFRSCLSVRLGRNIPL